MCTKTQRQNESRKNTHPPNHKEVYSHRAVHATVLVHIVSHPGAGSFSVEARELGWWWRAVGPVFSLLFGVRSASALNSKIEKPDHTHEFPQKILDVHPNMHCGRIYYSCYAVLKSDL
jgi:hypothetical protein